MIAEGVTRHRSKMTMECFETRQDFIQLGLTMDERLDYRSAFRTSELTLHATAGVGLGPRR
jgi:hypothetical protein